MLIYTLRRKKIWIVVFGLFEYESTFPCNIDPIPDTLSNSLSNSLVSELLKYVKVGQFDS